MRNRGIFIQTDQDLMHRDSKDNLTTLMNLILFCFCLFSSSLNNNTTRFVNDFKPRSFPAPFPTVESRFSMYNTLQTVDKKFEMLKQKGVSIHVVALQNRKLNLL